MRRGMNKRAKPPSLESMQGMLPPQPRTSSGRRGQTALSLSGVAGSRTRGQPRRQQAIRQKRRPEVRSRCRDPSMPRLTPDMPRLSPQVPDAIAQRKCENSHLAQRYMTRSRARREDNQRSQRSRCSEEFHYLQTYISLRRQRTPTAPNASIKTSKVTIFTQTVTENQESAGDQNPPARARSPSPCHLAPRFNALSEKFDQTLITVRTLEMRLDVIQDAVLQRGKADRDMLDDVKRIIELEKKELLKKIHEMEVLLQLNLCSRCAGKTCASAAREAWMKNE